MAANSKKIDLRLTSRTDYLNIKKYGAVVKAPSWLVANIIKTNRENLRVGLTLPGYVGGAVIRNRLKRWVREYVRKLSESKKNCSYDINIIFRRSRSGFYEEIEHKELDEALKNIFRKIERYADSDKNKQHS